MLSIRTLALICSAAVLLTACSALRPPDDDLTDPNHPINAQGRAREEAARQAGEAHDAAVKAADEFHRQSTEAAPATTTNPQ